MLHDLYANVAVVYIAAYVAIQAMPYCTEVTALMEQLGHPLSLLEGDQSTDTPWGLGNFLQNRISTYILHVMYSSSPAHVGAP